MKTTPIRRLICGGMLALTAGGCVTGRSIPIDTLADDGTPLVRLTLVDARRVTVRVFSIDGDTLRGEARGRATTDRRIAVPLDEVREAQVLQTHRVRTGLVLGGVALLASAGICYVYLSSAISGMSF